LLRVYRNTKEPLQLTFQNTNASFSMIVKNYWPT